MENNSYIVKFQIGNRLIPVAIKPEDGGKIFRLSFPYYKPLVEEVKSMAGKKWHPETKTWTIANCRRNLFAFDILTNGSLIAVYDKEIEDYYGLIILNGFWEHQKQMYNDIMTRLRCLLAAEMRVGKTLPTLKAIDMTKMAGWWIAPKSALRGLEIEIKKWKTKSKIELITYEGMKRKVDSIVNGNIPEFVVFDEIQKLKNPGSARSDKAQDLSDMMYETYKGKEYVVGLTGTPSPKDPRDWWNICEVIQPGYIRESNIHMFGRRLGEFEQKEGAVGQMYWQLKRWKKDEVYNLHKRLKGLVSVYLKKDCLDLPAKVYEVREIEPELKVIRVAEAIANNATNVLVAVNKLRQLSDGFQYIKEYNEAKNIEERVETRYVGSPKLVELEKDLELHEDIGRLIVYAGFQGSVDLVVKKCLDLGWVVLQVDGRGWQIKQDEFLLGSDALTVDYLLTQMDRSTNDKTIDKLAFVAQTESAGTGLELSASPTIIYYSNSNNGDGRMQSEDRAHSNNMDKNRGLTIIDYCHLPTDYTIRDSLLMKKDLQSLSLGQLKEAYK